MAAGPETGTRLVVNEILVSSISLASRMLWCTGFLRVRAPLRLLNSRHWYSLYISMASTAGPPVALLHLADYLFVGLGSFLRLLLHFAFTPLDYMFPFRDINVAAYMARIKP